VAKSGAEATQRFDSTADDLRTASKTMQKEIEETREQLRRGVLDMPTEAREATAAMRRAVTEQIEAINELSKIVARYGGDATSLATAALAEAEPTEAPPAATPVAVAAPEPAPAADTNAAKATASRSKAKPAEPEARAQPAQDVKSDLPPVTAAPAAQSAAPRPKSGNGEARGWVSDLLRRASSGEDEPAAEDANKGGVTTRAAPAKNKKRSPAQVVESLNSLSIDIARAIDHEASIELWDRYKRGERNVFTRRLYTLQGQKTFDEIRRKYERDNDFRSAVDNYIGDFERLLSQVSRDDTDPTMSRKYLTSDTGKVYTMLAHAAGRLN